VSDHRDTPDPRTDITDLDVFPAPGGGDRSVLVLNINPDASALEPSFDPDASYELKIDTDGDFEADVAFPCSVRVVLRPRAHRHRVPVDRGSGPGNRSDRRGRDCWRPRVGWRRSPDRRSGRMPVLRGLA
jgi:hypothetical protein